MNSKCPSSLPEFALCRGLQITVATFLAVGVCPSGSDIRAFRMALSGMRTRWATLITATRRSVSRQRLRQNIRIRSSAS
jgi:hypothetical protein